MRQVRFIGMSALFISIAFVASNAIGGDPEPPAAQHKKVKLASSDLEDICKRGMAKGHAYGVSIDRVSLKPDQDHWERDDITIFFEYADRSIGVYYGNTQPDRDQFIVLDKNTHELLSEVLVRARR